VNCGVGKFCREGKGGNVDMNVDTAGLAARATNVRASGEFGS
jgi:hypothetical protein